MILAKRSRVRKLRAVLQPLFFILLLGYFCFHAVEGDRGLRAYGALQTEIDQAHAVLAGTRMQQQRLEARINLLKDQGLDTDLLEERARVILDFAAPDEWVVRLPGREIASRNFAR